MKKVLEKDKKVSNIGGESIKWLIKKIPEEKKLAAEKR